MKRARTAASSGPADVLRETLMIHSGGIRIRAIYAPPPIPPLPAGAVLFRRQRFVKPRAECKYWRLPTQGRYRLYWSDSGTFDFDARSGRVRIYRKRAATQTAIDEVLRGPVYSLGLIEKDFEPLHASAVTLNGKCFAFAGASGAGKSSRAAYLVQRGAQFLSDDVLPLSLHASGVRASAGLPQLRLTAKSARRFRLPAPPRVEAKTTYPTPQRLGAPVPLAAIYLLQRRRARAGKIETEQLTPAAAFKALVSLTTNNSHAVPSRLENQMRVFGWLAANVPVRILRYPSSFSAWPRIARLINI